MERVARTLHVLPHGGTSRPVPPGASCLPPPRKKSFTHGGRRRSPLRSRARALTKSETPGLRAATPLSARYSRVLRACLDAHEAHGSNDPMANRIGAPKTPPGSEGWCRREQCDHISLHGLTARKCDEPQRPRASGDQSPGAAHRVCRGRTPARHYGVMQVKALQRWRPSRREDDWQRRSDAAPPRPLEHGVPRRTLAAPPSECPGNPRVPVPGR